MMRKIIKGSKWLCIKTVIMDDTEEIAYTKGKTYNSEKDDCITDEQGLINHWWTVDYFNQYFKKVKLT